MHAVGLYEMYWNMNGFDIKQDSKLKIKVAFSEIAQGRTNGLFIKCYPLLLEIYKSAIHKC